MWTRERAHLEFEGGKGGERVGAILVRWLTLDGNKVGAILV